MNIERIKEAFAKCPPTGTGAVLEEGRICALGSLLRSYGLSDDVLEELSNDEGESAKNYFESFPEDVLKFYEIESPDDIRVIYFANDQATRAENYSPADRAQAVLQAITKWESRDKTKEN